MTQNTDSDTTTLNATEHMIPKWKIKSVSFCSPISISSLLNYNLYSIIDWYKILMKLLLRTALAICFDTVVASSFSIKQVSANDQASVLLKKINANRLSAELPNGIPTEEQVEQVKYQIVCEAAAKCLCFEEAVLEHVDGADLVKLWIITRPLAEIDWQIYQETRGCRYRRSVENILEHDRSILLLILKQLLLIPDKRISSIRDWCDNFKNYFIAAYEQDCPEIDQLGIIRLQLLKNELITDGESSSANFVQTFIGWHGALNNKLTPPFRTITALSKNCNSFVAFLDFYIQFNISHLHEKYFQMLHTRNVVDYSLIDNLRHLYFDALRNPLSLSPMRIIKSWTIFRGIPVRKTCNDPESILSEEEQQWVQLMSKYRTCPKSVDYLREEFIKLPLEKRKLLLSDKLDENKRLLNLAFHSHFKEFHTIDQLHQLFLDTINSFQELSTTLKRFNFPTLWFVADADRAALDWIRNEQAPIVQDLKGAIKSQIIRGFCITDNSKCENSRLLRLQLLFQETGSNFLDKIIPIDKRLKELLNGGILRFDTRWINTAYSLLRKDQRYVAILFQPILFKNISLGDHNQVSDYPQHILDVFTRQELFSKIRLDMLSRVLEPRFDHMLAATTAGKILEMDNNDIEQYVLLGWGNI